MRSRSTLSLVLASALFWMTACGQQNAADPEPGVADAVADVEEVATTPTLAEQLAAKQANFERTAPPERVAAMSSALAVIADSGIVDNAITKGDKAPDFRLQNAVGESVSLYEELAKGPVILTWYRGSWCPYCNLQMHDYQKYLGDIRAAGAQLIAVSPQLPDGALTWKEKNELEFIVLSDTGNNVAREYGIVFTIPDAISAGYKPGGRNDLTKINGDDSLELPLAVTYVIGTDGTVEYAFVDADYRKRAETTEVVTFLRQL